MAAIPGPSAPADVLGASIVMLGVFDPLLLQPAYLGDTGLLSDGDLAELQYQFLSPDITVMSLKWMRAIVEPTKFTVSTTLESPIIEPIRDFVFTLYDTLKLRHVTAVGYNYDTHFAVASEEEWHALGHRLAPKDIWEGLITRPGTASLTIRGQRTDELEGAVNVKIEPSGRVHPGIYINFNDHMALGKLDSDRLVAVAAERFVASKQHSDEIVAAIKDIAR